LSNSKVVGASEKMKCPECNCELFVEIRKCDGCNQDMILVVDFFDAWWHCNTCDSGFGVTEEKLVDHFLNCRGSL